MKFLCSIGLHLFEWQTNFWEHDKKSPFNEPLPTIHWQRLKCRKCKCEKWKVEIPNPEV